MKQEQSEGSVWLSEPWISLLEDAQTEKTIWTTQPLSDHRPKVYTEGPDWKSVQIHTCCTINYWPHSSLWKAWVKVLPKAAGVTDQSIHIMAYLPITPCYPEPFTSPKVYVFILKWKQTACRFCRGFGFRDTSVFLCLFSVLMSLIIYCILIIMTQVLRLGGCEHGRLLTSWAVIPSGLLPWYSTLSPFVVFIVLYAFCRVCLVENI